MLAISEAAKLNPWCEKILLNAALMAPSPVPYFLFFNAKNRHGMPLGCFVDREETDDAIAVLRSFALVEIVIVKDRERIDDHIYMLKLHSLVREIAIESISCASKRSMIADLLRTITINCPRKLFGYGRFTQDLLWPHAMLILQCEVPVRCDIYIAILLSRFATVRLFQTLKFDDARLFLRKALMIARNRSKNTVYLAEIMEELALFLSYQEEYSLDEIRKLREESLCILERKLGIGAPQTSRNLYSLGYIYQEQGKKMKARNFFARADRASRLIN